MPPLFGLVSEHLSPALFPLYLLAILLLKYLKPEEIKKKIDGFFEKLA